MSPPSWEWWFLMPTLFLTTLKESEKELLMISGSGVSAFNLHSHCVLLDLWKACLCCGKGELEYVPSCALSTQCHLEKHCGRHCLKSWSHQFSDALLRKRIVGDTAMILRWLFLQLLFCLSGVFAPHNLGLLLPCWGSYQTTAVMPPTSPPAMSTDSSKQVV